MKVIVQLFVLSLLLSLCMPENSNAQCFDYEVPYLNFYGEGLGATMCKENCNSIDIGFPFAVWPNDAYFIDGLYPGAEYSFNTCFQYDEAKWATAITVAPFTNINGEINIIEEELIAFEENCEVVFTIPETYTEPVDVVFVMSIVDSCRIAETSFIDNGYIKLTCGPNGGQPDCPKEVITCNESRAGVAEAKSVVCFGDIVTINFNQTNIPTEGDNKGFACIVSTRDISGEFFEANLEEYVGILDSVWVENPRGEIQASLFNDGNTYTPGETYYFTPFVFGNAIRREPSDLFPNLRFEANCSVLGNSIAIELKNVGDENCLESCEKLKDGSFESGTPNMFWEENSLNFDTPLCDASCAEGTNFAKDGNWWAWFGGKDNGTEESRMKQEFDLGNAEQASLEFYFTLIVDPAPDRGNEPKGDDLFEVRIDDEVILSVNDQEYETYQFFEKRSFDISEFIDGCPHELEFYAKTKGLTDEYTNFFVDSVSINACSTEQCLADAGQLNPLEKGAWSPDEIVQVTANNMSGQSCYSYIYLLTRGAPDYEIVSLSEDGLFELKDLFGEYTVHGLSYQGDINEIIALNLVSGQELLEKIDKGEICADLHVGETGPLSFGIYGVGIDDPRNTQSFSIANSYWKADANSLVFNYNYPMPDGLVVLRLYDMNGRVVAAKREMAILGENSVEWMVNSLASGVYFLSMESEGKVVSRKFVVE